MLRLDYYAYFNGLRSAHPAEKAALAALMIVFCLVSGARATFLLVIAAAAFLAVGPARVPASDYLKLLAVPVSFLLAGVATVAFSVSPEPGPFFWWWRLGPYCVGVTAEGLQAAATLFLKSLGAVSGLYFLSLTTPSVEIFMLLKKLRVPSLFVELMSLVYRFIFVLLETAEKIYLSQSSRWGYANLRNAYFSLGRLGANLFGKSYSHAQMLYSALLARGYTGELNVLTEPRKVSARNVCCVFGFGLLLLLTTLWGRCF